MATIISGLTDEDITTTPARGRNSGFRMEADPDTTDTGDDTADDTGDQTDVTDTGDDTADDTGDDADATDAS